MLKEEYSYNKEFAQKVLNELPITTIKQITKSTEIFFDPKSSNEDLHRKLRMIINCLIYIRFLKNLTHFLRILQVWVLKLEFNKAKMTDKNIQMADIHHAIILKFNIDQKDISCFYTDDNADNLIMRIQCNLSQCDDNSNMKIAMKKILYVYLRQLKKLFLMKLS